MRDRDFEKRPYYKCSPGEEGVQAGERQGLSGKGHLSCGHEVRREAQHVAVGATGLGEGRPMCLRTGGEPTMLDTENEGSGPKPACVVGRVGKSRALEAVSRKAAFICRTVADGPQFQGRV